MNGYPLLAAAVGIALVAGCASTSTVDRSALDDEEKSYVTGSRIPVRGNPTHDVKSVSTREGIQDMMRPVGNATGGVTGASGN